MVPKSAIDEKSEVAFLAESLKVLLNAHFKLESLVCFCWASIILMILNVIIFLWFIKWRELLSTTLLTSLLH